MLKNQTLFSQLISRTLSERRSLQDTSEVVENFPVKSFQPKGNEALSPYREGHAVLTSHPCSESPATFIVPHCENMSTPRSLPKRNENTCPHKYKYKYL